MIGIRISLPCLLLFLACGLNAELSIADIGSSLVDARAKTIDGPFGRSINGQSFQQDMLVSHMGYQYIGYYDAEGYVCVGRKKLPYGNWEVLRLTDYTFTSDDAHNVVTLGICPKDGTIHLAFDHHVDPLNYRRSAKGVASRPSETAWTGSLFGPIQSELEPGKPMEVTYPRFIPTPDGGLQFCYRRGGSGNGDRMLVDYCAEEGTWKNLRQIDSREGFFSDPYGSSDSRCSYPNPYTYGPKGLLHVTWVWRESAQGANHDLMYAYSEDGGNSWKNNAGTLLDAPPHLHSPGITVVDISRDKGLMNTHGQTVDSKGRVHVVLWHTVEPIPYNSETGKFKDRWGAPEDRRYFHYFRDLNGNWQKRVLPQIAGSRPKVFADKEDNLVLVYGSIQDSHSLESGIYFARGDLVIASATAASEWTDWKVIHVEKGPFLNEMLGDPFRFQQEGVLSVVVQATPKGSRDPSALKVVDFSFRDKIQK